MTADEILAQHQHRPFPLPRTPWIMMMWWHDLLFAHWPVDSAVLRTLVPEALSLDTYDGQCWAGITPFHMHTTLRGVPRVPRLSWSPELNVRTYVTLEGRPGVYFFSLDIATLAAVWGARIFYRLPYFHAEQRVNLEDGFVGFWSRRIHGPKPAEFAATYAPSGTVRNPAPGTLEHFLTERYCLYSVNRQNGRVYRAEIHHVPWPLQDARALLVRNSMAAAAGIALPPQEPLAHYARELQVLVWAPERVGSRQ